MWVSSGEETLCHTVYDYTVKEKDGSKKIEESEFQVYQRWNGHDGGNYRKEMLDVK